MKTKLLVGLAGLLLASSTMFAGWGAGFSARGRYYAPRHGVYVGIAPGYYGYGYAAPAPYVSGYVAPYAVPGPYVNAYAGPAPYYGAAWYPGRWGYGPRGRYWARGYWGRHR